MENISVDDVIQEIHDKLVQDRMNSYEVYSYLHRRKTYIRHKLLHEDKQQVVYDMIRMYYEMIESEQDIHIPKPYTHIGQCDCNIS